MQAFRFELLFDFGVLALQDGYFREAVTSFNAALERAYEFFMRDISARTAALQQPYRETWKLMSAQSERQLGAFSAFYLLHTSQAWIPLKSKMVELRNNCVHKGYFPSRMEAFEFGVACLDAIWRVVDALQGNYDDLMRRSSEFSERHIEAQALILKGGGLLGSVAFASVVDVMHRAEKDPTKALNLAVANTGLRNLYPRGS